MVTIGGAGVGERKGSGVSEGATTLMGVSQAAPPQTAPPKVAAEMALRPFGGDGRGRGWHRKWCSFQVSTCLPLSIATTAHWRKSRQAGQILRTDTGLHAHVPHRKQSVVKKCRRKE